MSKKSQHILKNHGLVDTIIHRAKIKPTDIVLEVGAGNGSITLKLLEKARKVIAFENDPAMARELKSRLKTGDRNKLELIEEDVLSHDFGHFDVCISNIPFHISLPLILKLLPCDFRSAFLLVQKEFAARLTARPGSADYSRLSVMSHLLVNVEHITKVARNSFIPPPNVDTCFIKLEPKIPRPEIDVNEFGNMLKLCFNRKNKMLISNLKSSNLLKLIESDDNYEGIDPSVVIDEILERANLADARPSKMEVEDFLTLLLFFKQAGFHF